MMWAAQTSVATSYCLPRLAKMAAAVHLQVSDERLSPDAEIDSVAFFQGRPIYLRTNSFGDVAQLGYRLFPSAIKEQHKGIPVFDFLERYLLELDLRLDGKEAPLRMDIDQVTVVKGSLQMLHQLKSQAQIQLNVDEITRKMYRVEVVIGQQVLTVVIPADSQLLYGGNIIELEQSFVDGINRIIAISPEALINNWDAVQAQRSKNLLVIDGGYYRIEDIRGDIYLTVRRGQRQLLLDRRSPMHSVSNMMLTGVSPYGADLRIDFHVYGNSRYQRQTTLQQFVDYCKSEGCQLYFGTKTLTTTELTGTLFAYNEKYAYTHMLSVTVPLTVLESANSLITGHAYVYVPLHDITEQYINNASR